MERGKAGSLYAAVCPVHIIGIYAYKDICTHLMFVEICLYELLSCEGQISVRGSPTPPPHMRRFKRDFFLDCCWICDVTPGFCKASAKLNWCVSDFTLLCCFQYFITILLEYHVKPSPHCPVWPWLTQILSIEPENTLRQLENRCWHTLYRFCLSAISDSHV